MMDKLIDLCEEQCGFSRDSQNPDSRGWRDILEWLMEDDGCKAALLARFQARLADEEEPESDWTDQYADMAYQDRQDSWFELAKKITERGGVIE